MSGTFLLVAFIVFCCNLVLFLFLEKKRRISKTVLGIIAVILACVAFGFFGALFANDFHVMALVIQLILPLLFAISALDLLGVNILLLGKRGFFTKKRLVIIGALLVILIITGIGYGRLQTSRRNDNLTKYPDIEFSDTYYLNLNLRKSTYGYWDSESNTCTEVDGSSFTSVVTEEQYKETIYFEDETGDIITPFCIAYNKGKTAVYYSNDNKIFRYDKNTDEYTRVAEFETEHENSFAVRKIAISDDERTIYAITMNTSDENEDDYMYYIDTVSDSITRIISDDGRINDFEISPDGTSIIYYGGYKVRKYDIASGARTILLDDATPKKVETHCEGIIRISDDGRYIMYCIGAGHEFLKTYQYVYVYDIKENTTDIVLKTDLCTVKNVDWVR